ncbi:MAG: hypothetical protein PETM_01552 [Petrimonas sp.]|uniref:RagB/SusD family nutrient uptake outer membrane protein n=1 Tax=Petrimonas sp. TaxID=2023866 RepID=UPI0030D19619
MKKTIYILLTALIVGFNACEVLDTKPLASYDEATVWGSKATADAFINGTISNVMNGYVNDNQTTWEERTNNMVSVGWGESLTKEEINRESGAGGFGNFGNIRRCNLIIEKAAEYNGKGLSDAESKELIAKGKLLRAALYYQQARTMGRFVWVDRVMTPADTINAGLMLPTTKSTTESYRYILKDLEEAIPNLPITAKPGELTQNVAYAFQSEIALQAAAYEPDAALKKQWLKIVIAAADKIKESGKALSADYGGMFNERDPKSSEIIFAIYRNKANTSCHNIAPLQNMMPNTNNDRINEYDQAREELRLQPGDELTFFKTNGGEPFIGWLWWSPTQNLVDAYDVIDQTTQKAVPWSESSQFKNAVTISTAAPAWAFKDEKHLVQYTAKLKAGITKNISELMYEHRDKRFYETIVYDGSTFYGEDIRTTLRGNLWRYVNKGLGPHIGCTNYYWRKGIYNIQPRIAFGTPTDYHFVVTRYGRVLLNKAEAILWLAGLGEGNIADAVALCNQTRTIHGGLPASTANTLEEAWKLYMKERRVELALENDYYWSLLRWGKHGGPANYGIAPNGKITEFTISPAYIEITNNRQEMYVADIEFNNHNIRRFDETRRYLLPIPQGQINRNPNLGPQNPGW